MNLRDSNERLLADNKKLIETIKEHEVKAKNEELKGQEQLLEILKSQTPSSSDKTSDRKGAKAVIDKLQNQAEKVDQEESQTPESSDDGSREKTVEMMEGPGGGDSEGLQLPEAVNNVDLP